MDVAVYCRPWYAESIDSKNGVRQIFLPSLHTKHLDAITHTLFSTLHAMFVEKPDVIHYHGVGPALISWIPRVFAPRIRVVVTFHSMDRTHDKWGPFARLMLRLGEWSGCRNADRTITVSQSLQRYCRDVYDIDTSYLPNGVTSFPESSPGELAAWHLVPGHYVLFVGRLIRLKGLHTLIAAYKMLPERIRTTYPLVIAGEAYTRDYLRELTVLSRGLNVKFVGNQVGAPLAALYRGATAFIMSSETESMPIVVLEAAGNGLPVVASDIPAHREILADQGIYFENKNTLDLANVMLATLNSIDEHRARAKAFAPVIEETYSWDRIARETEDVYRSTVPLATRTTAAKRI
jgi:glycosyltransferase involved in cell wall biosynthesis